MKRKTMLLTMTRNYMAAAGSTVGSIVSGHVTNSSGGLEPVWPLGTWYSRTLVSLVLGQESASWSTDNRSITRFSNRYGTCQATGHVPGGQD